MKRGGDRGIRKESSVGVEKVGGEGGGIGARKFAGGTRFGVVEKGGHANTRVIHVHRRCC